MSVIPPTFDRGTSSQPSTQAAVFPTSQQSTTRTADFCLP